MANEKKLDCVILGLLSHEDLTGYEIKKRMDSYLKFFWSASFGSIYPTLKELVINKLVESSKTNENGRDKIVYTITKRGLSYLKNWLQLPVYKDELRYETLLKLFFGSEAGAEAAIAHIENFESKIKEELPLLLNAVKNLENVINEDESHLYYLLTVTFGVKVFTAYLEWCEEATNYLHLL
ncbi:MAG: PadR family transcriptional regulator [Oscillospiraceae bacterium]|nr:PadR family transcriptional regulator [Oscillospiraceae bacterium]